MTMDAFEGAAAARLADDVEADAFADLYDAAPAPLRAGLGLRVVALGGARALLAPGLPSPMFNRVIGWGLHERAELDGLEAIEGLYDAAGVRTWWLHWNPWAAPAGFDARLLQRGYAAPARRSWAKVVRAATPAVPVASPLAVQRLQVTDRAAWGAVIAQCYGMPAFMADWLAGLHGRDGWRLYALRDGDAVVGGAGLFIAGRVAWLGLAGVAVAHRRRHGQRALMARRIDDACAAGCTALVTETGEPIAGEPNPSLANIFASGFQLVASRLNLERRPSAVPEATEAGA
jgi:hypothetical protein